MAESGRDLLRGFIGTTGVAVTQQFDASKVRVVLFDLFNTVVSFDGVPRDELRAYADHIRKPEWSPFRPPESWGRLRAFPDSRRGLDRIIERGRDTSVLSNCPYEMASIITAVNGLSFTSIIQLAAARVFKPQPRAYQVACDVLDVPPEACLMVTANKDFGDLEQARALGMQAALIRDPESDIPDIIALAERLGC